LMRGVAWARRRRQTGWLTDERPTRSTAVGKLMPDLCSTRCLETTTCTGCPHQRIPCTEPKPAHVSEAGVRGPLIVNPFKVVASFGCVNREDRKAAEGGAA